MQASVLYYTLGGGMGHAVRGLALARQLQRTIGGQHYLLINTPFACALNTEQGIQFIHLPSSWDRNQVQFVLKDLLNQLQPQLFIVDTFPRGLGGELTSLFEKWQLCPRVLIARNLCQEYVYRYHLSSFVQRYYNLVLAPGEPVPYAMKNIVNLPPFFIRDLAELPDRSTALHGLLAECAVTLIVGTGTVDECRDWICRANTMARTWPDDAPPLRMALPPGILLHARCNIPIIRHFPLMELFPGAALIFGNAGYHLFHETRYVGINALLIARPRKYDQQDVRLKMSDQSVLTENGARLAASRIHRQFFCSCSFTECQL